MRELVQETYLNPKQLIQPYFVIEGKNKKETIDAMPGIARMSIDYLLKDIESFVKVGGKAGLFFGIPDSKDPLAKESYSSKGIVQRTVKAIKKEFPDFMVITDICLCGYTDHGHCGIIHNQTIDNDKTLPILEKIAISHAEAGADIVAPSDMMDFRVKAIRQGLDKNGFLETAIMSYAVKYASSFYGPFRDALHSTPKFGDRKTYQMDYANKREALKEAFQDIEEGADFIMVKPALAYLDIIAMLHEKIHAPIVAYSVSGEYSMVKAAAAKGWINEMENVLEQLTAIKRAGANLIITYYAKDVLSLNKKS
jgi:porphobilinogen synthase